MFSNAWENLMLKEICDKHPELKIRIANFVIIASESNSSLEKIFSRQRSGSEGKVYKFLFGCVANHQNLLVSALNSLSKESEYFVSAFVLTKHNLEYVSVAHCIAREIYKGTSWETIEKDHIYNTKSIVQYLEMLPVTDERKKFIGDLKRFGKSKNIIEYIKGLNDENDMFVRHYALLNALSHPNHYTTVEEKFPYVDKDKLDYLIDQMEGLQKIMKWVIEMIAKKQ